MHRRACVPISLYGGHYGRLFKTKALAKIVNDAIVIIVIVQPSHQQNQQRVQIDLRISGIGRFEG